MKSTQSGLPLFATIPTLCHGVFLQIIIFKINTLTPDLLSLIDNKPIREETITAHTFCYLQNKDFFLCMYYIVSGECASVYVFFVYMCVHMYVHTCGSTSLTSGVFLITYQLLYWNRISCLSPQFTNSANPMHWDYNKTTLYLCRTEDLSYSLHMTLT